MTPALLHPFALDAHPAKAVPASIDDDVRHFARIEAGLAQERDDLDRRLAALLATPGGNGQEAYEREVEIMRLNRRARLLRRFGADLCIGRVQFTDRTIYIGRVGLADADGDRLLVDWRTPAAEPFFGATRAHPMGAIARRRYRWTDRRVTDYWDETFTDAAGAAPAALDDQSAFIAGLGASRTPRMRDVLGTIQADQDAIIRADGHGALVVDGGPGTGKTVVALHRAAYLLYSDPLLRSGRGGVLFIGPSHAYTDYVSDILPGLGEEGVRTCTLADLVPEGAEAVPEPDRRIALLKGDGRMPGAIVAAIRLSERPPTRPTVLDTAWGEVRIGPGEWAEAIGAADPAAPHNDARAEIWEALLDILVDVVSAEAGDGGTRRDGPWGDEGWGDAGAGRAHDTRRGGFDDEEEFDAYGLSGGSPEADAIRRALADDTELPALFDTVWPLLDPAAIVRGLWSSPSLLLRCAPWLSACEAALLQRAPYDAWTLSDLPLLDAALQGAGDPERDRRRRAEEARAAADRAVMDDVISDLIASDDSDLKTMSMLRGQDLRGALDTSTGPAASSTELLAGPFAHLVVDEAQELTAAEWSMLIRRVPSLSLTVVGDRAQARHGFPETWTDRLAAVGLPGATVATLSINYRTPVAVMEEAAPVIRAALPDANVPTSIRDNGIPVRHAAATERDRILDDWLTTHEEGTACVIDDPGFAGAPRVRSLSPVDAKGLEFDLVLLGEPARTGDDPAADITTAVDRYVAMTRTTGELVLLEGDDQHGSSSFRSGSPAVELAPHRERRRSQRSDQHDDARQQARSGEAEPLAKDAADQRAERDPHVSARADRPEHAGLQEDRYPLELHCPDDRIRHPAEDPAHEEDESDRDSGSPPGDREERRSGGEKGAEGERRPAWQPLPEPGHAENADQHAEAGRSSDDAEGHGVLHDIVCPQGQEHRGHGLIEQIGQHDEHRQPDQESIASQEGDPLSQLLDVGADMEPRRLAPDRDDRARHGPGDDSARDHEADRIEQDGRRRPDERHENSGERHPDQERRAVRAGIESHRSLIAPVSGSGEGRDERHGRRVGRAARRPGECDEAREHGNRQCADSVEDEDREHRRPRHGVAEQDGPPEPHSIDERPSGRLHQHVWCQLGEADDARSDRASGRHEHQPRNRDGGQGGARPGDEVRRNHAKQGDPAWRRSRFGSTGITIRVLSGHLTSRRTQSASGKSWSCA